MARDARDDGERNDQPIEEREVRTPDPPDEEHRPPPVEPARGGLLSRIRSLFKRRG